MISFPNQLSFSDERFYPTMPSDLQTKMTGSMKTWATQSENNGSLKFPPQNLDWSIETEYPGTCGTYLMSQRPLRLKHSKEHASESILNLWNTASPIFSFVICCNKQQKRKKKFQKSTSYFSWEIRTSFSFKLYPSKTLKDLISPADIYK